MRTCRDCPIENCGSKHLVKLSNLATVHGLNTDQRKKWLQLAKQQPIEKVILYANDDLARLKARKKKKKANKELDEKSLYT